MHPRNPYARLPWSWLRGSDGGGGATDVSRYFDGGGRYRFEAAGALEALTAALLARDWACAGWACAAGRLCPPLPGRLNYVLWAEDLVARTSLAAVAAGGPAAAAARGAARDAACVDVGTGASAVLALLAARVAGWACVATELDAASVSAAAANVARAGLAGRVVVRPVATAAEPLLAAAVAAAERLLNGDGGTARRLLPHAVVVTLCNPPFFASWEEAQESMARARGGDAEHRDEADVGADDGDGDGIIGVDSSVALAACHGAAHEMACAGGEVAFVGRLIEESVGLAQRVLWFTSMLGKLSSVAAVAAHATRAGARAVRTTVLVQGRTRRWAVAWSFAAEAADALIDGLLIRCPLRAHDGGGTGEAGASAAAAAALAPAPALPPPPPMGPLARPFALHVGGAPAAALADGSSSCSATGCAGKEYRATFAAADAEYLLACVRETVSSGARADDLRELLDRIDAAVAAPRTPAVAAEDAGFAASAARVQSPLLTPPFCDAVGRAAAAHAASVLAVFRGHATLLGGSRDDAAATAHRIFSFEVQVWRLRDPALLRGASGGDDDEPVLVVPVLLALDAPDAAAEAAHRRRFDRWADRLRADVLRTGRRWRRGAPRTLASLED